MIISFNDQILTNLEKSSKNGNIDRGIALAFLFVPDYICRYLNS